MTPDQNPLTPEEQQRIHALVRKAMALQTTPTLSLKFSQESIERREAEHQHWFLSPSDIVFLRCQRIDPEVGG